MVEGKVEPWNR